MTNKQLSYKNKIEHKLSTLHRNYKDSVDSDNVEIRHAAAVYKSEIEFWEYISNQSKIIEDLHSWILTIDAYREYEDGDSPTIDLDHDSMLWLQRQQAEQQVRESLVPEKLTDKENTND